MQSKHYSLQLLAFIFICVFFLGCANKIRLAKETVPTPLVQTLPLSMAIYYDESLQTNKTKIIATSFGRLVVDLIDAQNTGFDRIFLQLYEKTESVNSIDAIPFSYDGLISIKLNDFEIIEQRKTSNTFIYFAEISYDIDIYDNSNKFRLSLNVTGEGEAYDKSLVPSKLIREASKNALRDAFSAITLELIKHADLIN